MVLAATLSAATSAPFSPKDPSQVLFDCEFRDGSLCDLHVWHQNNAFLDSDPEDGAPFLHFILKAGQNVTFALPHAVKSPQPYVCIRMQHRRGAAEAGGFDDSRRIQGWSP